MDRRNFLKLSTTATAGLLLPGSLWNDAFARTSGERILSLSNIHTGETVRSVYWAEGSYLADGLAAVDHLLRDHRTGDSRSIDRALLEQLHALALRFEKTEPFEVISGYRSPHTNEMLRKAGRNTARKSFHLTGQAVDIRLPGVAHDTLHRAAVELRAGGVGDYAGSRFVHLDTGPVRTW